MANDFDFFAFPNIVPDMPAYEDVPLDVLVMPARARNPRARKRFLAFLAESGGVLQLAAADQTLPAQQDASSSRILLADPANRVLSNAAATSPFFDREARADLIGPVFEGLRHFLKAPHDTDQAVTMIENLRTAARRTPAPQ
jgi:multiple sugar transport system substrate-binding protein